MIIWTLWFSFSFAEEIEIKIRADNDCIYSPANCPSSNSCPGQTPNPCFSKDKGLSTPGRKWPI